MEVLMIGTPFCSVCKRLADTLTTYCAENNIPFRYQLLSDITDKDVIKILTEKKVSKAPAFLIYRGDEIVLATGDNIFLELDFSIKKKNNSIN